MKDQKFEFKPKENSKNHNKKHIFQNDSTRRLDIYIYSIDFFNENPLI